MPPKYRVVLDEAVLRRHIGGPAVMRAQLDRVLTLTREDKTTVQVIPYTVGAYGAVDSNFTYPDSPAPSSQTWCSSRLWSASYT
jgi:hypothetical protein